MKQISGHKKIHMIGIGGCSMNGLAQILVDRGFEVQGSDAVSSPFTKRLQELGIPVFIGHSKDNVKDADLIIYSAAIKEDNVERQAAKEKGIPQLERSEALGDISQDYDTVVGIAGCHGKTTITSMLAYMAKEGAFDATVHVGGYVNILDGGTLIGTTSTLITEACEYVESFLTLHPKVALIHNIDDDHLDYYRDIDHIVQAFQKYLGRLPEDGVFLACTDDVRVKKLFEDHTGKKISYGKSSAEYTPSDISYDDLGNPSFNLLHHGVNLGRIELFVPGEYNLLNAVAAACVALTLGAEFKTIQEALKQFRLTRRRFEFYGENNGVKIYHDFAHHPGEIRAVLQAALRVKKGKLYCVFQCNSYTRAKTLFTGDMSFFSPADEVLVVDIFPGREKDTGMVHACDMVKALQQSGVRATYLPTFEDVRTYLSIHALPGDMVLTLGSGDVYQQTNKLL